MFIVLALKLGVLGLLVAESVFNDGAGVSSIFNFQGSGSGAGIAAAATTGVGAPPALDATLPGSGPSPYAGTAPQSAPPTGTAGSGPGSEERTLPSIILKDSPAPAEPGTAGTAAIGTRDYLLRRQEDLARKEQELRVLESELNSRLERMQMLENRLSSMIKDAEETTDAKFRHLVDVLSNMKSKQAAAVLETLDPKIAVRVLAGMRGRQAGEILTFVRPEIAAKLTESLARIQLPLE